MYRSIDYIFLYCFSRRIVKMFGFKASLNFYNGSRRKTKKERAELGAVLSVTGAYRTNRDDSFGKYFESLTQK